MPHGVNVAEQYRLANRIADHLLTEPDHDSFAARVLEYTPDEDRENIVPALPVIPWTREEIEDIR